MYMLSLAAALLLGAPAPGQDSFSDPNLACRQACRMDGLTGQCHTNFCSTRLFAPGTMVKACCKRGVKEYPCDGTVGCAAGNCCTAMKAVPAPLAPPPPPPPLPSPRPLTDEEARAASMQACDFAALRFKLGKITEQDHGARVQGEYTSSAAQIHVTPWVPELRVVALIRSRGEYIQVMEVDGASLQRYEQVGAFLRLTFKLDDEPERTCVASVGTATPAASKAWRIVRSCGASSAGSALSRATRSGAPPTSRARSHAAPSRSALSST